MQKPRLLVVGSAVERREPLALEMKVSGIFEVVVATSALDATGLVSGHAIAGAVCVWPLNEPKGGLELLRFLRRTDQRMPIVVVGGRVEGRGRREILSAGADVYFPGFFDFDLDLDLVAAHMEVGIQRVAPVSQFCVGDLSVDINRHQVSRGDTMVLLTPIEFRLLKSLVERLGEVVSKKVLFEEGWRRYNDPHGDPDHLVGVHLSKLRKKLHACGPPILHTIYGVGYVLRPASS